MAGQTDSHISLFSPQEVEFMAEDELEEIVPNMNMDPLNFISGDYGRLVPQIPTQVLLWLAVALKRRGKCTFRPPRWLSVGTSAVKMLNASAMEVNLVRPFVRRALEAFYKPDKPEAADADRDTRSSSRQPREANNETRRPLRQR